MKFGSTLFLRLAIAAMALVVLALCVFVLPYGIATDNTGMYKYILLGMYVTAVPFYIALYHVFKLLGVVDANKAFSLSSVWALKNVKRCALVIGGIYTVGLPYIYYAADNDDAPGVLALALIITGASYVIAAAAALLQQLVQHAVDLKDEHDLTV